MISAIYAHSKPLLTKSIIIDLGLRSKYEIIYILIQQKGNIQIKN